MTASPRVVCYVNSCTHFMAGNLCGARNIDIMHEDEEHMSEVVDQTMCKSFHEARGVTSYLGSMDNVNWVGSALEITLSGHQLDPSVSCTVASCTYWREGRVCVADAIEVTGVQANECQDTNCKTFEPHKEA